MKRYQAINDCRDILKCTVENPAFEAGILAQYVFGLDKLSLLIHKDDEVSSSDYLALISCARRRVKGEPVAYITGHREFMSLDFAVTKDVLIPRPDTEILVEAVIDKYKKSNDEIKIIDFCCGSGAIACSLAYYIDKAFVVGVDISEKAIEVAKLNACRTGTEAKTKFCICDILDSMSDFGRYDIVVSNPPYIETKTIDNLDSAVRDFEPHLALDGGDDGLKFYKSIADKIELSLKKGGELYFEIGYNQAEAVSQIMESKFTDIKVFTDLAGHARVVKGQLE